MKRLHKFEYYLTKTGADVGHFANVTCVLNVLCAGACMKEIL